MLAFPKDTSMFDADEDMNSFLEDKEGNFNLKESFRFTRNQDLMAPQYSMEFIRPYSQESLFYTPHKIPQQ